MTSEVSKGVSNFKAEVKKTTQSFIGMQGKLFYFWNKGQSPNFEVKNLPYIDSEVEISDKNEIYQLGEPACFWDGVPCFFVIRGVPFSIKLDFTVIPTIKDNIDRNDIANMYIDKDKNVVIPAGLRPSDIHAKVKSPFIQRLFRQHGLSPNQILTIILMLIITALTTYMITMWSIPKPK